MRKKAMLGCVLLMCTLLCGCSDIPNHISQPTASGAAYVPTDMIAYHRAGSEDFSFNLNLFTEQPKPTVEYVRCSGTSTEGLSIRYHNDTSAMQDINDVNIDGYYITNMGFLCHSKMPLVKISSITLKINGKEKTIPFKKPIVHELNTASTDNSVSVAKRPMVIAASSMKSETENNYNNNTPDAYSFAYAAATDAEIVSFGFNDLVQCENGMVYVNNEEVGSIDEALPLHLSKNDTIRVECNISYLPETQTAQCSNAAFNAMLTYHDANKTANSVISSDIYCQSISNYEDAKNVVQYFKEASADAFSAEAEMMEMSDYDKDIYTLTLLQPTDIAVLGDEIHFDEKLQSRMIASLDETELQTDMENQIVLISDMNGTVCCDDAELERLKTLAENENCSVYYIGSEMKEQLAKTGLLEWCKCLDCTVIWVENIEEPRLYLIELNAMRAADKSTVTLPYDNDVLGEKLAHDFALAIRERLSLNEEIQVNQDVLTAHEEIS